MHFKTSKRRGGNEAAERDQLAFFLDEEELETVKEKKHRRHHPTDKIH